MLVLCMLTPFPILRLSPSLSRDRYSVLLPFQPFRLCPILSVKIMKLSLVPRNKSPPDSQGCGVPICSAALLLKHQADANTHIHLLHFDI